MNESMTRAVCGAKTRKDGSPCQRPAGWGTQHVGTGRCKLHGGCSTGPISRYNKVKGQLAERMARHELDPDPANLIPELTLMRSMLEGWLELHEADQAQAIPGAVTLTENIRKIVNTIHQMQTRELITAREYDVALTELTRIIVEEVRDADTVRRIADRFRAAFAFERAVVETTLVGDGDEAED